MKLRLEFEKNIRYISHLELMKAMGKILKRCSLGTSILKNLQKEY